MAIPFTLIRTYHVLEGCNVLIHSNMAIPFTPFACGDLDFQGLQRSNFEPSLKSAIKPLKYPHYPYMLLETKNLKAVENTRFIPFSKPPPIFKEK